VSCTRSRPSVLATLRNFLSADRNMLDAVAGGDFESVGLIDVMSKHESICFGQAIYRER